MFKLQTSESTPVTIQVQMNPPSVYLDYCVIADFITDAAKGKSFQNILLQKGGTLCISSVHLIEMYALGTGPTYSRIESYLASFGDSFVLLDFNANAVISRERNWKPGDPCPAFDLTLTREIFNQWNGLTPLDLSVLSTGLEQKPELLQRCKQLQSDTKKGVADIFQSARHDYRSNSAIRNRVSKSKCPDPQMAGITEYVYCALERECIKTNDVFTDTDGLDFYHAVVALSYLNFVVLDKKWARRSRSIQLPPNAAKVFATNEYDSFLQSLSAFR